ncbi:MAG: LysR family transcriptional regulator [Bradyrhizobium sp.]|nr:LysR family transcriptional regulator [Bradyrhizobium sp.]
MELRQLRYFMAVAEELSFVRAAKRVGISQPPLSRQIANLEAEIGTTLFNRNKHGVTITEAGTALHQELREILPRLEGAIKTTQRAAKGQVGTLALGFGGSAVYTFTPALLRHFRRNFPDVELSLRNVPVTSQLDALLDQRIDIGFIILPVDNNAIATRVLLRDKLTVALPSGHPLTRQKTISVNELSGSDFLVFPRSRNFGFYNKVIDLCTHAGFMPNIVQEISPLESQIGLVAAGVGVAIVPSVAQKFRLTEVEFRPLRERTAYVEFAMAWRKSNTSPAVRAFIEVVSKVKIQERQ